MTATINASTSSGVVTTADNSGVLQLQTASTAALTIDGSQNVGIGTSSPAVKTNIVGSAGVTLRIEENSSGNNTRGDFSANITNVSVGAKSNSPLVFTTNDTERMRIDAGGTVYINTTTDNTAFLNINHEGTTRYAISCNNTNTGSSSQIAIRFNRGTSYTQVGTITTTNAATSYASGSDYRLKDNVQPMTGALAKVALLKPVTFNWTIDGSDGQGFIAHELQEVCPDAVTGSKDAVDENGKPEYQGVDTSFLVATLTAAIQEQQALIQTLTDRITALEGK